MTQNPRSDDDEADAPVDEAIQNALRGLRFGSVEIVVHDGKIVQVVRTERVRVGASEKPSSAASPTSTTSAKTSRRV